ncbi:MAG: membrane protein insertase YidC [Bacilli bacterium]|nr:membrane protein insertase YidC [Bacilli bacterium]
MKKSSKLILSLGALTLSALVATGCTSNFCTSKEKSRMLFAIEPGVSVYYASEEEANAHAKEHEHEEKYSYVVEKVYDDNPNLWRSIQYVDGGNNYNEYTKSVQFTSIVASAKKSSFQAPGVTYLAAFDTKLLSRAANAAGVETSALTVETAEASLKTYGYLKFYSDDSQIAEKKKSKTPLWGYYDEINNEIAYELGVEYAPTNDFVNSYQSTLNSTVSSTRSCIAVIDGEYGNYGQEGAQVTIDKKTWGYAWSKGPISGLIVWPVAALLDVIATSFAGGIDSGKMLQGWPQLLALVIVTVIVRLVVFAATFKSVLSQQKMQALQPELAKLQQKYPNSNTSQSEKQRLAEEQMKLYKKHKVNPLSQLLVIVIQFPIFIGVWGAMTGSAVLSTGTFLHLNLSTSIWTALKNVKTLPSNVGGWWTALVLFLLMAIGQFLAMKVPQWISKAKAKKVARLGVNPAQKQQNRTMNIVSYAMLIMIIIMGFTLPAAMGVYWFVGAIFSLAQSLITQLLIVGRKDKNRR